MPQVVLIQPLIPPNTGNIARTCAATQTPLHLVGPLGFDLSDRHLKRAGLDYWPHVNLQVHEGFADFQHHRHSQGGRAIGFSTKGTITHLDFQFAPQDWLLFGQETAGLPPEVLEICDALVYIPMSRDHVRSLNLSVSVAVGLFEAKRQLDLLNF
jgi:tRNA (cytidine/uridine-2'-O-)-methyltransferase